MKGFTLIEFMVIMVIIGILFTVVASNIGSLNEDVIVKKSGHSEQVQEENF